MSNVINEFMRTPDNFDPSQPIPPPRPAPVNAPNTRRRGANVGRALAYSALAGTGLYLGNNIKNAASDLYTIRFGSPEEKKALIAKEELKDVKKKQAAEEERQESEKELLKAKKETEETQNKIDKIKAGEDPDDKPFLRANNPWIIAPLAIAAGTALYREKRKREAAEKEKAKLVDPNFKNKFDEPKTDSYKPPHN